MIYRRPKVLVLGDMMLDLWAQASPRASNPEGAALIATGGEEERQATLGGAGLVATLLRSMGMRVRTMSRLGTDTAGMTAHSVMHESRLTCKHMTFSDNFVTPAKMRFINDHGHVVFRYDEESTTTQYIQQKSCDFDFERYTENAKLANAVVIADYGKGYCQFYGQKIIEAARYYGALSIVGAKPAMLDAYQGADIIKVNAAEAKEYIEMWNTPWSPDRHETVQAFCELTKARIAIITMSRHGAVYAVRDDSGGYRTYQVPAKPCFPMVANCVGAGDAYLAGLTAALLLPPRLRQAPDAKRIQLATAAASATAAQYLNRGVPVVDPVTPYLASYEKNAELASASKIVAFDEAAALSAAWRSTGDAVVFTNGCFDLLHRGHVALLEQAKQQGKKLIVAVNTDESVRLLKGANRPVQSFETRAQVIASLGCVDAVVALDEEDFAAQPALRAMITTFVPDVLVKGAQYKEEEIIGLEEMVNRDPPGRLWRCPMVGDVSTTQIVERIQNAR